MAAEASRAVDAAAGGAHRIARRLKTALITGITGQDGSLLAELLVGEGIEVIGVARSAAAGDHENLSAIAGRISLVEADLRKPDSLRRAVEQVAPDEIYHLAAPTFVPA